ncbi:MAG: GAF domain-containing protein [Chloroflexota bacterium]
MERKSHAWQGDLKWSTMQAILEASNELIRCNDLDTLCRRTVELARERLGVERCSLFLLDTHTGIIHGTYGTDMQRRTVGEYHLQWRYDQLDRSLLIDTDALWHINYGEKGHEQDRQPDRDWVAYTWMKQRDDLVALFCNDTAISGAPVDGACQQAIAVYCSMVYGIIRRIQSDVAQRESESLFEAIFNAVTEAVFVHDKETGKIVLVNREASEMFGYATDELLQAALGDLSAGTPPYSHKEALKRIRSAANGDKQLFEWRARHRSGRLFWVEISMGVAFIGNAERVLVTVRDIDERKRYEQTRNAMYQIAATSLAAESLDDFYPQIHEIIGQLMPAKNFFIALYDAESDLLDVPYYVDQYDPKPQPRHPERGLTSHVLRTGQPLLLKMEEHLRVKETHAIESLGTPAVDWLGVPLIAAQGTLGVMAVQTYEKSERLTEADCEVLVFVSSQVAMTVQRKRAEAYQQKLANGLRSVVEAADELLQAESLDDLYRRAVELGRKKVGLERCSLFLLDQNRAYLVGTYGTDAQGNTTDERAGRMPTSDTPEIFARREQLYVFLSGAERRRRGYWQADRLIDMGPGWIVATPIYSAMRPLGVLYNDSAISNAPFDLALQEITAIYCSILGNILDRKQLEAFEKHSMQRLNSVVKITDELIACTDPDVFYRKAVELAREKLGIERCAIFLFDPEANTMRGTYGTDLLGQTTDEHGSHWQVSFSREDETERGTWLFKDLPWIIEEQPYTYQNGADKVVCGRGWVAHTAIYFGNQRLGTFANDTAISHAPPDGMLQETIRIYCSLLGSLIQRLQSEHERQSLIGELSAKNAELERFTYTVSHDLKAPLITIRGFLGFLAKDAASGNFNRLNQDVNRITRATEKMEQLLDDLLQLSRVGRIIAPPQTVPFGEIVNDALDLLRGVLARSKVIVKVMPDMPTVYGDRVRLVEVLQNLIENAIKFMGEQTDPCIDIGFSQDGEGAPVFYVRDNGIGIEPRYHERIFGLFDKLDAQSEGTGIGLALVRRIVEMHGGRIWVESEGKGCGSTFRFSLGPA